MIGTFISLIKKEKRKTIAPMIYTGVIVRELANNVTTNKESE